jgi:type VI secretion system protein ImpL
MNRFSRVFLSPWFWGAVICCCLSALVWWGGPWVRIADVAPFQSWWARLLLIVGFGLAYAGIWAFRVRASKGTLADQTPALDTEDKQDMLSLERGFSEALRVLRAARTQVNASSAMARFLARFDRQSGLYSFPWFLTMGLQGSGKTAVVKNSGFKFRLDESAKQAFKPTHNCEWMFADEAVFLDMAGRYTAQENNRLKDAADWRHFLKCLKRTRTRQPINGVVLTVSADVLINSSQADLMNHANVIRQRLYELQHELSLEVPVYVLITKCDLVAGFNEFFDSLSLEERQQVWGLTLDLPNDGKNPVNLSPLVSKMDGLFEAIQTLLLDKLQKETDINRRSLMGFFPQSLRVLQQALVLFTESAFNQNPYQARVLLRGVYFTSAAQHGQGVDPLRAVLPAEYGLASTATLFPPQTVLRSYFLGRLFSKLILGEAHLASRSVSWSRKQTLLRYLSFLSLFVGGLVSCFALGVAYYQNQDYIEMVDRRLLEAKKTVDQTQITSEKDIVDVLPALDQTFALVNLPDATFTDWWGMGQRSRLMTSGQETYLRMLDDSLLAFLNTHMEQHLKTTYRKDPDRLYETLRVYLMLHNPSHFDAASVENWAKENWPSTLGVEQRERLDCHLQRLLMAKSTQDLSKNPAFSCANALALKNTNVKFKQHRMQEDLVQEVRSLVSKDSLPQRVYGRIKRLDVASNIAPFRVIDVVGLSASSVFTRVSQKSLGDGVKGFYTADGYEKAFLPALPEVLKELQNEEVWVLGNTQTASKAEAPRISLEMSERFQANKDAVKRLYLEDYAKTWENFVNDFRIVSSDNVQGSLQVLRFLLSANSPLHSFLQGVSKQTSLVRLSEDKEQQSEGVIERLKDSVENRVSSLSRSGTSKAANLGENQEGEPESIVDNRFSAIHRLVKAPESGGVAPIDSTFVLLKEFYAYLSLAEDALKSKETLPKSDVPIRMKSEARMLPSPLNEMLRGLSDHGLKNMYGEEGKNLSALMGTFTAECKQAIESRYPFDLSSNTEVKHDDFQHFFAPNGLIDRFFRKHLEPLVDVSTKPWSFKSGFDVDSRRVVRSSDLDEFQRADAIRQAFFSASGDIPLVRFSIKPVSMDQGLMQSVLEVDGQVLRYRHDAVVPVQMTWPNANGGGGVIRLMLTSLKGEDAGSLTYGGDWALWRAIEQKVEKTARPETVRVTFKVRDHSVTYEITAATSRNPFLMTELDTFHCPTKIN